MSTGPGDEGLEATEVPTTPASAFDPAADPTAVEAEGSGDGADAGDGGPGNSDPGF